jgi:hypothetical protein
MRRVTFKTLLILAMTAVVWLWHGDIKPPGSSFLLIGTAEAFIGRPATPISYAGVARRSTVGVGAPGVGVTPGVGVGASGVGVTPGVGVGAPGMGVAPGNRGGPVNRVGVR